jgi:hypothetical protein
MNLPRLSPWILLALCLPGTVHASPTRSFVLDSASTLSEGKLDGTTVESDGSINAGTQTRRTDLPGVQSAKSLLVLADGSAYVGTGNDGKIYQYRAGALKLFAETKQVMVSALAIDARGTLYAGTLPSGKIFAISAAGQLRQLAAPEGAEHVWALAYDEAQKILFAATGPQGKLFAIDDKGKADVYYDSEDAHIMALARAGDGSLVIGTSDRALLVRLRGAGRAEVIYDFEGNEVTALALRGTQIAVVANLFPKAITPAKPATPAAANGDSHLAGNAPAQSPPPAPDRPSAGKGQLYRVNAEGQVEKLFTADEGHLSTVEWADDDVIYVGTGKEGHIHRVRASSHDHALFVDVDERQILAQQLTGAHPIFTTGDGAAVYELGGAAGNQRDWTSKVLDAGGRARFGQLVPRAQGAIALRTRSGNTDKPDSSWSDWSAPLTAAGPIRSPAARFLQVKLSLSEASSVVYALEAFYLADNQAPLVSEVSVEPPRPNTKADKPRGNAAVSSNYKLRWKVDNPDNDSLRYRLYVAHEGTTRYRALLRESDPLTGTEYTWDTDAVQDGYYRLRVEASDELDNPDPLSRKARAESEPFLVDNRPPEIPELRLQGVRVIGSARDEQGPISRLEYNVDGQEWHLLRAEDDLLDSREERFSLPMLQLPKGEHVLAVRAYDARGNSTARELTLAVP